MSVLLYGAKGLAKELINAINIDNNVAIEYLYDDVSEIDDKYLSEKYVILRSLSEILPTEIAGCIIAVGGANNRKVISEKLKLNNIHELGFRSELAAIGDFDNNIHHTVVILQNTNITMSVTIGKGSFINKNVLISHDVVIGEYVEISPCATLLGNVKIGDCCEIGANATVLPGIAIGRNSIIGAGAVITKDIPEGCIAVGIPAKYRKIEN